jgi:orotate phosphoribosyltransferase
LNFEKTIAENLLQIKAIKLSPQNPFTWTSGILSPIYCDNRMALSFPEARNRIMDGFMARLLEKNDIQAIAAVATAGIPWGAMLSHMAGLPFAYVRDKPKGHGRQNQIEGHLDSGTRVLLIEDLISTGKSAIAAAQALREAGIEVVEVLSIFNYGMKIAKDAFESHELLYSSLSHFGVLVEVAGETGYIRQDDIALLQQWSIDPSNYRV